MTGKPAELLQEWLRRQLPEAAQDWLAQQLDKLADDASDRTVHIALGMVPRRLGKDDLALDADALEAASQARPGWDPRGWSVDEAARILILLTAPASDEQFVKRFTDLCRSADVSEAIAYYRGLPLYPAPELLEPQAAEGVRTNMRAVFEAVAHRNPYPRERFDQNRWNQMVLKALFVDSTLKPIQGLDERANFELAQMLCDYAHERWAAQRKVSPELWRCVGRFATGEMVEDLRNALSTGDDTERKAAALALSASPTSRAKEILTSAADLVDQIENGTVNWDGLGQDA